MQKFKFLLLTGAVFLSTISCNNTGQDEQEIISQSNLQKSNSSSASQRMSNSDLEAASVIFNNLQKLHDASAPEALPYDIYTQWLEQEKLNVQLDPNLKNMMSFSYEESINYLVQNNYLDSNEVTIVNKLNSDLLAGVKLDVALSDFENSIGQLDLSETKKEMFSNFVGTLTLIDYTHPGYFEVENVATGRLFGSCLSATIGMGLAIGAIATIEVGSWGSATVLSCAGYVWASGEWVAACRKSK